MSDRKKILIVEDDPISRELIKEALTEARFEIIEAANGQEGIDKAILENPQLVICDVLMPIMDGFMFYKELKKDEICSQIPVLILTARGKMEDTFKAIGVNGFLPKPYKADVLLREVVRLLAYSGPEEVVSPRQGEDTLAAPTVEIDRTISSATKRVFVYGSDESVLNSMQQQLKKEQCEVFTAKDPSQIIPGFESANPNIVIMEIFENQNEPLAYFLREMRKIISKKSKEAEAKAILESSDIGYQVPHFVLYKGPGVVSAVTSLSETVADTEHILEECREIVPSLYIGLFSPISFISKIKGFL